MFIQQFLTIATIHLLAVMSPGPDLAVVIRNSLGKGKQFGIFTAIGIGCGIMTHVTYALLGIALIISQTPWLFNIIRYIGAGYLVYMGIMSLRSKGKYKIDSNLQKNIKSPKINFFEAFRNGYFTNLLNPGASVFLLTVFTQVIVPGTPALHQTVFGLWMVIATFLWFAIISSIISIKKVQDTISNYKIWVDRIMGIVLILLAIKVIFFLNL